MPDEKKQMPAWLLGLIVAAALFAIGIAVASALDFGDDPAIDPNVTRAILTLIGM